MPPVNTGHGADVEGLVVVTDVGSTIKGEGVHGIHLAFCLPLQQRMILGMVPVGSGVDVPRPVALLADIVVGAEVGVGFVGTANVHGLVGIDSGRGGVGD